VPSVGNADVLKLQLVDRIRRLRGNPRLYCTVRQGVGRIDGSIFASARNRIGDRKVNITQDTLEPVVHANRDPITGEPGSHPVGTGLGSAGGAGGGGAGGGAAGGRPRGPRWAPQSGGRSERWSEASPERWRAERPVTPPERRWIRRSKSPTGDRCTSPAPTIGRTESSTISSRPTGTDGSGPPTRRPSRGSRKWSRSSSARGRPLAETVPTHGKRSGTPRVIRGPGFAVNKKETP